MDKIGYMGIPGSFSEVAANELLAQAGMTETELVPLVCAKNILEAMQKGEVQYGVLGVENSTAGPVGEFVHTFENISYENLLCMCCRSIIVCLKSREWMRQLCRKWLLIRRLCVRRSIPVRKVS